MASNERLAQRPPANHLRLVAQGPQPQALDTEPCDDLMRRAQDGEHDAINALVRRYQRELLRVAGRYLNDTAAAWDVVQQTLLIVLVDKLHDYRFQDRFQAYVFTVLIRQCHQAYRRGRRFRAFSSDAHSNALPPEAAVQPAVEDGLLAQQATCCLTPKLLDVVTLRYGAGLSFSEIAQALGIEVSTARRRHFDAMERMQAHLEGA
jgi:RNA polymerase sigma-70 factor, ECF subfamily